MWQVCLLKQIDAENRNEFPRDFKKGIPNNIDIICETKILK